MGASREGGPCLWLELWPTPPKRARISLPCFDAASNAAAHSSVTADIGMHLARAMARMHVVTDARELHD